MDVTLGQIIARIESGGFIGAVRFEPSVMSDHKLTDSWIANIKRTNKCNTNTARMIASTSWGKYQLMGFNLYDSASIDCAESIGAFLNDESFQDKSFNIFVTHNAIDYRPRDLADNPYFRSVFAKVYNGSTTAYSALIVQSLQNFGFTVKP